MAIKKLQNNYTTPEQSKRLLKLGVPADSADCYLEDCTYRIKVIPAERWDTYSTLKRRVGSVMFLPCWSVGRLIEIYNICVNFMPGMQLDLENEPESCTYIELIVSSFELAADDGLTYFSKLEE